MHGWAINHLQTAHFFSWLAQEAISDGNDDRAHDHASTAAHHARLYMAQDSFVCAGCSVRSPWEHRCHGGACACTDCPH